MQNWAHSAVAKDRQNKTAVGVISLIAPHGVGAYVPRSWIVF